MYDCQFGRNGNLRYLIVNFSPLLILLIISVYVLCHYALRNSWARERDIDISRYTHTSLDMLYIIIYVSFCHFISKNHIFR